MIFPNNLRKGDIIGVTAMSFGCKDELDILRLENAHKKLNEEGFKCVETEDVRKLEKLESDLPQNRAKQFMDLWKDNDVKAIVAVGGGEILMETLPYLDFNELKKFTPKWVQGYSDPSLLNYVITTKLNVATINSVNFKSFGMEKWHKSLSDNISFLKGNTNFLQESFDRFEESRVDSTNPYEGFALTENVKYKELYNKEKSVRGRVIGGCIDVLKLLLGTNFDNTVEFCSQFSEGMLWYFDNCELNIAEFYRVVWQMKQAGWFNNANGFLIGRTAVDKEMFDFTYEDALHKAFDDMNVPVFYDVDIGHLPPQWVMVNGSFGEFQFENGKGKIVQNVK